MYPHKALSASRPWNRTVNCFPGRIKRGLVGGRYPEVPYYWLWEPLESWKRYSTMARALLNIVAELRQRRSGRREDWLLITPIPPADAEGSIEKNPWRYVAGELREWFSQRPVVLACEITDNGDLRLELKQAGNSLLGYIRLQLAFAIGRGSGLALCASCARLYSPKRRPNPNRQSFCPRCGRAAAMRAASVRYRRKKKEVC
jgi:hypothetical protein